MTIVKIIAKTGIGIVNCTFQVIRIVSDGLVKLSDAFGDYMMALNNKIDQPRVKKKDKKSVDVPL